MFHLFLPRQENFFVLFRALSDQIVAGALEFALLLEELPECSGRCASIKDIEHKGDEITHQTVALLHKTFITPLDRDEIHRLITKLDDILDFIDACAQRICLYDIGSSTPEAVALSKIVIQTVEHVRLAVAGLADLKNPEGIQASCVEINRLENEADVVLRAALAKLFREEKDLRQLIKLKEVYELLETVTDRCEDVANIIDGIVLEQA